MRRRLRGLVDLTSAAYHLATNARIAHHGDRARVLIYHRVCEAPPETRTPYWNVPPARFAEQLDYLLQRGYTVLTAAEVVDHVVEDRPLPPRSVAITFDDGFANNHAYAFRLLRDRGLRATFYVVTKYIGSPEPFPFTQVDPAIEAAGQRDALIWRPMRWDELLEMHRAGMEVGSHSHTHPFFSTLTPEQIEREIDHSVSVAQSHGIAFDTFAASYSLQGARITDLKRALTRHRIRGAFLGAVGSVKRGVDPFDLPRIPIYESDDMAVFARKVDGAYDWMSALHPLWRRLFHRPNVEGRVQQS